MSTSSISETSPKVNNPVVHIINGREWREAIDLSRPFHFRLICDQTGQNVGARDKQQLDDVIDMFERAYAACDDLAFAVHDSMAVKARIIGDQMRDENAMVNGKLGGG